jgi:hypothetical protein
MAALEVERFLEAGGEVEEEQPAAANGNAEAAAAAAATPELVMA